MIEFNLIVTFFLVLSGLWLYLKRTRFLKQIKKLTDNLRTNTEFESLDHSDFRDLPEVVEAMNSIYRLNREKLVTITKQRNSQKTILSGMKEGLIALDENGRISEINDAAEKLIDMQGIRKRGRLLQEILRSGDLVRHQSDLIEMGKEFETEIKINQGTAHERIFQVRGYLTPESIESHHSLIVFTDITRLRKLENMRQEFVANVSHELKTPLTSIRGYAETLKGIPTFGEEIPQKFLTKIESNADRLHHIIEDLLNLSRLEQNGLNFSELESLSLTCILDRLKQELSDESLKRVTFSVEEEQQIYAHGPLLHQALYNLIENALKYSGDGKSVHVHAENNSEGTVFSVKDDGVGIAQEHLPLLMDRFYRAEKDRNREKGGSGLGLSIVKHIAESHGGEVQITSLLGSGSEFEILIPKIEKPSELT